MVIPPSTYKCLMPRASSRETISTGSPDRCSTTAPTGTGASKRELKTKTGFSPYGHSSNLNTCLERFATYDERIDAVDKLIVPMGLTASWRQEIEFTIGPSNKTIYASTDKD